MGSLFRRPEFRRPDAHARCYGCAVRFGVCIRCDAVGPSSADLCGIKRCTHDSLGAQVHCYSALVGVDRVRRQRPAPGVEFNR